MSFMQGSTARGKKFYRLANASWLIDASLFADRQMHWKVQKRVWAACTWILHIEDSRDSRFLVSQLSMVFWMFRDPIGRQTFQFSHW